MARPGNFRVENMTSALVGHTGFVGGNLARQFAFTNTYHSRNIEQIRGKQYRLLVVSGAPAAKWIANREPEQDLANLRRLMDNLAAAEAASVVLISTVDVYPHPRDVDERTSIDPAQQHPYGRHRLMLEQFVQRRFSDTLVLRLPALFGVGLKKNAIYDLLHDHETHKIHCDALFQFYDLDNLWADIERIQQAGLRLVNLATEPISIAEIARVAFGFDFSNRLSSEPARYDVRTIHDRLLGGDRGYLYDKARILEELKAFVAHERGGQP
jgi:nucleoside-diphosphate-sugar epimerase